MIDLQVQTDNTGVNIALVEKDTTVEALTLTISSLQKIQLELTDLLMSKLGIEYDDNV